jgi:hypothetical protein
MQFSIFSESKIINAEAKKKRHLFTDAAGNKSPDLAGLKYLILFTKNIVSWL